MVITRSSTNQDNDQRLITSTDDSQFTWLWWWLPLGLSKRQSMSPQTVLLRTTLTRTITIYRIIFCYGCQNLFFMHFSQVHHQEKYCLQAGPCRQHQMGGFSLLITTLEKRLGWVHKISTKNCEYPLSGPDTSYQRWAWENACQQVTIGLGFTSDWLRKWRELFSPTRERRKAKPNKTHYFRHTNENCSKRTREFRHGHLQNLQNFSLSIKAKIG